MGMAVAIGIGILCWILLSVLVALVLARVIRQRDRQCPGRSKPESPAEGGSGNGPKPSHPPRRWRHRSTT
jgi:hypothetical protein